MNSETLSDAALVLVGHGTTLNAASAAPVYQHAAELRRRRIFGVVREAFWKQEPALQNVLAGVSSFPRVYIVPLFMSEGYFSEQVIPRELGFEATGEGFDRVMRRGLQELIYCKPIGTHAAMTGVVLDRARGIVRQFPFPRPPVERDITLFIAGHGTGESENSRKSADTQADLIRAMGIYRDVHTVFLEEEPRIGECYRIAETRHIVMVPYFSSDGLHVTEDIPVLLGESRQTVEQRLAKGQSSWRNPTEKNGKLIWYTSGVGTDPLVAGVILERVQEQ